MEIVYSNVFEDMLHINFTGIWRGFDPYPFYRH